MNRKWMAALSAIALALLVLACGSGSGTTGTSITPGAAAPGAAATAAPAPAAAVGKIGDRVETNGIALTLAKVERKAELGQFMKAKDGNTYVVAEVLIENVSADKSPYNPLYFTIKDGDGFEYNAGIDTSDTGLKSGELAKGEKARGTVAIEVKEAAKGLVLQYKPLVFGNVEPIRFSLD